MNKLLVISSAPLICKKNKYFAYSPYESEMRIWAKYSSSIEFCCPVWSDARRILHSEIRFKIDNVYTLKEFDLKSAKNCLQAIFVSLVNCYIIFKAIKKADHIHLRCPGNMSLLACFVQIFFPKKIKTAKYAGNWDPNAKQPWSYRLQKWILSNTLLTKNMQVLVYGEWPNQTKNIKTFFTATYSELDKEEVKVRVLKDTIYFLFIGTLTVGKQPLYALKIVHKLIKKGHNVCLDLYGEGAQRVVLEDYISINSLENNIFLHGNQTKEIVEGAYKKGHFLLLPSKSEGWPKVIAEAMFWGCIPVATPVSCVPYIVDNGSRGVLMEEILEKDVLKMEKLLKNTHLYDGIAHKAMKWSRRFTLDKLDNEVKKLLQ